MKHLFRALLVLGVLSLASAFSGIGSYLTGTQGSNVTQVPLSGRIVAAIYGCACLLFALCIKKRPTLASRLVSPALWFVWIYLVVGSTMAVASEYPKGTLSDELLFGGLVAVISLPIMIYWKRRLRAEFDVIDQKHG